MGRRVGSAAALLLLSLMLGVANAGGRTLAVTTVNIEVIGKGTVTSSIDGVNCGNGAKACYIAFSGSGTVTLTATPVTDWTFDSWENCPNTPAGNTCRVPVDGNSYEVTANFAGPPTTTSTLSMTYAGEGNVSGGNMNCGSAPAGTNCTWTVLTGSVVTVLEEPAAGKVFSGWSGACSGTSVACTVTMDGDHSINASWATATDTRLLTVSISGGGLVRGGGDINCPPTCTARKPLNSTLTLTATPDAGYAFTGWSGACSGSVPACTVTLDTDKTAAATFALMPELSVAVSGNGNIVGGNGAINCGSNGNACSANFALNSTVTLTTAPGTGATFIGWSGACGGAAASCTVLMSASKSVSATFSGNTVPLTVSVSGPGVVTGGGISCGNGSTTCTANQNLNSGVTLTATAAPGATFTSWGGACSGTATTCIVSMTSAKSVSAIFSSGAPTSVLLSVSTTGRGTVTGGGINCGNGATTCSANVTANSSVVLTATPAAGARFLGWGGVCSGTAATCTVTLNLAKTVSATFTRAAQPAVLTSLGAPRVERSGTKFLVTLRFKTTQAGTARVRGLRAGRAVTTLSRQVAVGSATIGPFPVLKSGLYTFELRLGAHTIHWRTCLGLCGSAAPGPDFVAKRGTPKTTRNGPVWSVTLHLQANLISEARVRAYSGTKVLLDKQVLAGTGKIALGPFLLAPGRYTLRLTAIDAYGRVRRLSWTVALAR